MFWLIYYDYNWAFIIISDYFTKPFCYNDDNKIFYCIIHKVKKSIN